jgi:hypothetical protein
MATRLLKPVKREIESRMGSSRPPIIVELRPALIELIVFREKGTRKEYTMPLSKVFGLAVDAEIEAARRLKLSKKKKRHL